MNDFKHELQNSIDNINFDKFKKDMLKISDSMIEDIEYTIRDNLAYNLNSYIQYEVNRIINRILDGDYHEMIRQLKCDTNSYNGRSDGFTFVNTDLHPIIHGKMHEEEYIALRRKILEKHKDLIVDQRILDLQDQVSSLVKQYNDLQSKFDQYRENSRY
jgi:hypothetical protein